MEKSQIPCQIRRVNLCRHCVLWVAFKWMWECHPTWSEDLYIQTVIIIDGDICSRTNWSNMCASGTIHRKGRCQYDTEIGGTSTGEEEEKSDRVNHKTTTSVRPLRIYKSQTDRRRPSTSLLYSGIIQSLSLWYEHTTWPKVNWAEHRDNGSGMCRAFMSKYGAASEQVSVFN